MLSLRSAFLALAMTLAFAPLAHAAGAFGMELGEHVRTYAQGAKPVFVRDELEMFEVSPPKPDARLDTYAVDTHKGRIIRIMASSPDDDTSGAEHTLRFYYYGSSGAYFTYNGEGGYSVTQSSLKALLTACDNLCKGIAIDN